MGLREKLDLQSIFGGRSGLRTESRPHPATMPYTLLKVKQRHQLERNMLGDLLTELVVARLLPRPCLRFQRTSYASTTGTTHACTPEAQKHGVALGLSLRGSSLANVCETRRRSVGHCGLGAVPLQTWWGAEQCWSGMQRFPSSCKTQ